MFHVFVLILLLLPQLSLQRCSAPGNDNANQCVFGVCSNSSDPPRCICDSGWGGAFCDHCIGRTLLNSSNGVVHDGPKNYRSSMKCSWLIQPSSNHSSLKLLFHEFASECGWDFLYIYDGDSAFSPLLATFNGLVSSKTMNQTKYPEIVAKSGTAFLQFYSDAAYEIPGFNISYSTDECLTGCSDHGSCAGGICSCNEGWSGEACDQATCDSNITTSSPGEWSTCAFDASSLLSRASYAAAKIDSNLWIYGGYYFSPPSSSQDLLLYNTMTQAWSVVTSSSASVPTSRYGHTMVTWNQNLIVFGGNLVHNETTVNELWEFNTQGRSWHLINYTADFGLRHDGLNISNLALFGHTAELVQFQNGSQLMVVMFGYHAAMRFSPYVYEYDPVSGNWSFPVLNGVRINGLFGHSSVYDPTSNLIYIHGGHTSLRTPKLTSDTYAYDPLTRKFFKRKSSAIARFLHAAVLVDGVMYVYGGNSHNDTNESTGALCFSPYMESYSLTCNEWHNISTPASSMKPSRYGHKGVAVTSHQNSAASLYFFSGYDSTMLSNLLIYHVRSCGDAATNESTCTEASKFGLACYWNSTDCLALPMNSTTTARQARSCTPSGSLTADGSTSCEEITDCLVCDGASPRCHNVNGSCQQSGGNSPSWSTCDISNVCDELTSCEQCAKSGQCMWCLNQGKCVDMNSYVVHFSYGQCYEWLNKDCRRYECSAQKTCRSCHDLATCGWCDDGSNTGLGTCMEGTGAGAILTKNVSGQYNVSSARCPASNWHFATCPLCQCNGHSSCNKNGACLNCGNNTSGEQCESCKDGYFGQALNGGTCEKCSCGRKATGCDPTSGSCYCSTNGEIGPTCEKCDKASNYEGNATGNGTCYYKLAENYQFTFTLTESAGDAHVTAMNFLNHVVQPIDVQVTFESQKESDVRLAIASLVNGQIEETTVSTHLSSSRLSYTFSSNGLEFSKRSNTTLRIYVSNFTIPCWLKISLLQKDNRLLHILLILFSSFLVTLFVAAVLWKAKLTYDAYRLRANQAVERREMAARPFAGVNFCCDDVYSSVKAMDQGYCELTNEPDAVCEEKLADDGVSVVSVFLTLPAPGSGDSNTDVTSLSPTFQGLTPAGQCPIALGTTLMRSPRPSKKNGPPLCSRTDTQENPTPDFSLVKLQTAYENAAMDSSSV